MRSVPSPCGFPGFARWEFLPRKCPDWSGRAFFARPEIFLPDAMAVIHKLSQNGSVPASKWDETVPKWGSVTRTGRECIKTNQRTRCHVLLLTSISMIFYRKMFFLIRMMIRITLELFFKQNIF